MSLICQLTSENIKHHFIIMGFCADQWNCSVPHWPEFKRHFPCNLQMDCVEGEDEADCPYVSPFCPHGYFSVGGGCFRYFDLKSTLTWNQAAQACAESGPSSYLAALNTPGEWLGVLRLLLLRKRAAEVEMVYIGLRYSGDVLPRMYGSASPARQALIN